jgi:hypothetical protein
MRRPRLRCHERAGAHKGLPYVDVCVDAEGCAVNEEEGTRPSPTEYVWVVAAEMVGNFGVMSPKCCVYDLRV